MRVSGGEVKPKAVRLDEIEKGGKKRGLKSKARENSSTLRYKEDIGIPRWRHNPGRTADWNLS